eukprot:Platyproteum_vivax@DN16098_c0_g1_i1.p1
MTTMAGLDEKITSDEEDDGSMSLKYLKPKEMAPHLLHKATYTTAVEEHGELRDIRHFNIGELQVLIHHILLEHKRRYQNFNSLASENPEQDLEHSYSSAEILQLVHEHNQLKNMYEDMSKSNEKYKEKEEKLKSKVEALTLLAREEGNMPDVSPHQKTLSSDSTNESTWDIEIWKKRVDFLTAKLQQSKANNHSLSRELSMIRSLHIMGQNEETPVGQPPPNW